MFCRFKAVYFYLKLISCATISEREKEFDKINSLKDQLKELQEKLDAHLAKTTG